MMPDSCIGVDVIVGFPGETDDCFMDTFNFLNNLDISYLHVFSYSERTNTEAVKLPNPVSADIKSERSKILRSLSNKKKRSFYESQIGKIKKVLFESENKKGYIYGFTDNYVKVRYPWNPSLINKIKCVKLTSIDPEGFVRISKEELELA